MPHLDYEPLNNQDFVDYIKQRGYSNAEGQIYGDYPQRFEPKEGVDLTHNLWTTLTVIWMTWDQYPSK